MNYSFISLIDLSSLWKWENFMDMNKIAEVQIQIIINTNLYKRSIIDENTYSKVNERLLKQLKALRTSLHT